MSLTAIENWAASSPPPSGPWEDLESAQYNLQKWAMDEGFSLSIRRTSTSKSKTKPKIPVNQEFKCEQADPVSGDVEDPDEAFLKKTGSKLTKECHFRVDVKRSTASGEATSPWKLDLNTMNLNHCGHHRRNWCQLIHLPHARKFTQTADVVAEMKNLINLRNKPKAVVAILRNKLPTVLITPKDVSNCKQNMRQAIFQGRNDSSPMQKRLVDPASLTRTALHRSFSSKSNYEHLVAWMTRPPQKVDVASAKFDTLSLGFAEESCVLHLKLNRPKVVNAMNMQMWVELAHAFEMVELDPNVKAVVVSGEGRGFTSGMDLDVFAQMQKLAMEESCDGRKREGLMRIIKKFQSVISAPETCRVPVIAAVHGPCIGAGVDFITACDLSYADVSAVFSVKEVDLAIIADLGTLQRLPKLVGECQAKELAFTGRNFGGLEAEKLGLVLKTLPDQEALMSHVHHVANTIATKSPITIRGIKQTIQYQRDHSTTDSLQQIRYHNAAVLYSDDLVEAVQAVMSKTTPQFRND